MSYETRLGEKTIAIFLFHGVVERIDSTVRNYTRKHLPHDYFASVIRRLKRHGSPVSLEEIRLHHDEGQPLPPRPFAITFDDGFRNNLTIAASILADESVPATFYVTTDFVDRNRMGWIDRIEFAVEQRGRGRLRLPWADREFHGDEQSRLLLDEVRKKVKRDRSIDPDALATSVQEQLDVPVTYSSDHPLDQKLSWEEVRRLGADASFLIAGHSHTHQILEFLSDDELEAEISTSLDLLWSKGGIRNVHYSYPEGLKHCYSTRVVNALKRRGIRCCPSAEDGVNDRSTDLFQLRRIMVT
jgi:peptidoglycan/xylan/chitin deacetylase (PgdA/CDA1 family)